MVSIVLVCLFSCLGLGTGLGTGSGTSCSGTDSGTGAANVLKEDDYVPGFGTAFWKQVDNFGIIDDSTKSDSTSPKSSPATAYFVLLRLDEVEDLRRWFIPDLVLDSVKRAGLGYTAKAQSLANALGDTGRFLGGRTPPVVQTVCCSDSCFGSGSACCSDGLNELSDSIKNAVISLIKPAAVAPLTDFWGRSRSCGGLGLGAQRSSGDRRGVDLNFYAALDTEQDDKYQETQAGKELQLLYNFNNFVTKEGEDGKRRPPWRSRRLRFSFFTLFCCMPSEVDCCCDTATIFRRHAAKQSYFGSHEQQSSRISRTGHDSHISFSCSPGSQSQDFYNVIKNATAHNKMYARSCELSLSWTWSLCLSLYFL